MWDVRMTRLDERSKEGGGVSVNRECYQAAPGNEGLSVPASIWLLRTLIF
jgi:hypothetical protein